MKTFRLFVLALAVAASTLAADETYVIKMSRPAKVGDRYRLDAKGTTKEHQRVTVGGKEAGSEDKEFSVHLVAMATVKAVDAGFSPTRTEYSIESCQKSSAGKTEDVLPAGRKVTVESRDGDTVYTGDGEPLSAEAQEALKLVLSAHVPDSPTDDEIFGTKERKKVGDKWGVNGDAAARSFGKKSMTISPANVKGSVSLDNVRTVGDLKALEISAHFRIEGLKVPLPEGMTVDKALMEADFSGLAAADPKSNAHLPDKIQMKMNFLIGGQKPDTGEKISVEMSIEMSLENSYPLVQEKPKANASLDQVPITRGTGV